jgi:AraC-like DNA-binding protein
MRHFVQWTLRRNEGASFSYIRRMLLHGSVRALRPADAAATHTESVQRHNEKMRRRYWRKLVGPLAVPRGLPPIPVSGTCDWHALGALRVGSARIGACGFIRDAALVAAGQLTSCMLVLLPLRGGLSGTADGQPIELRQGDIAFLDLACTLEVEASDGAYLGLLLPHDAVDGEARGGMVLRESHLPCRMLAKHLEQLVVDAAAAGMVEAEALARSTISIVQLCLDFAPPAQRQNAQSLRMRILAYIDANLHEPDLGPELIARTFHISRTWLYRIFAGSGGVRRCIRDKRLDAAFRDLCEQPRRRVIDIAWHRGFASERYFQRAFAERFGLNPSDVRNRSRQGLPVGIGMP